MLGALVSKLWLQYWDIHRVFIQMPSMRLSHCQQIFQHGLPEIPRYIFRTRLRFAGQLIPGQGHTQSLHTNALDEAIALPTDFSARIARNTQIYIQDETQVCRAIDPWAGSYYIETLTHEIVQRAWEHIKEVESLG